MTIILRHSRENLKKCSLRGLEKDPLFQFYTYPKLPPLDRPFILLTLNAPFLSKEDGKHPLLLIDGTWRYAARMQKTVLETYPSLAILRSLPGNISTAYPRKQTLCEDSDRGLASIEALYLAHKILGLPHQHLLDNYHWKENFLEKCDPNLEDHKEKKEEK
jgi:pre-rRNA-processing protein TSR3